MLTVCALSILNTTLMTVLGRRREIALQKALGWRSSTVFGVTLVEVGMVGLVAGGMGVLLAWGLAAGLHLSLPLDRALLILPLGTGLCLIGGLVPAWTAARVFPATLLQHDEVSPAGPWFPGQISLLTYGLRSLLRRRTRATLMVVTMGLASALLTVFLATSLGLHGYLSGTLLGEYLILRIEGYHYLMAGVCLLVAGLTTADALLVSTLERRREIGVSKAVGWRTGAVARLYLDEGLLLGLVGGGAGTLLGLAVSWGLSGTLAPGLVLVALLGVSLPGLVGLLAALYPAWLAARVPPAEVMRYE
jgi:ABC-type antimicrobial peptide transport system permease subunit